MHASDDQRSGDWTRIEVADKEQGATYCPGNGDVLFLNDRTTEADFFHNLTFVERTVLAARLRAWADMASYDGDEFKNEDDR